ncbi:MULTISPECIES: beta-Ala-His dipeptidase [unclassified Moraxella]|uniref:beta-Ala-His dipeptidase n=1 Tax=unclassified Moraxella TaxID=2685852 RepID=UPI003AF41F38
MTSINNHIRQLEPTRVWQWFAQICDVPHPTFSERPLGELLVNKANTEGKAYGLTAEIDAKGNVRIQKAGTHGMQDHATVALQAHYDMVAQKGATSTHDFINDPIQTVIKDGWVWANDTTLGADNGIGLAMGLAVAFSDDIAHPPLSLVITAEEETGMGGVMALSPTWLDVPYLINLDSEDEGAMFVGCAGGRDATFSHDFTTQSLDSVNNANLSLVQINVSGLHGGHSGIDIHKGFANANLVLARVLANAFEQSAFYLQQFKGGQLRNVITRDATAVVLADLAVITPFIEQQQAIIAEEYRHTEPNFAITIEPVTLENPSILSLNDTQKVLDVIRSVPNGVFRMSDDFDVVESSISTGVITLEANKEAGKFEMQCLMRSLAETPKDDISQALSALARLAGISFRASDDYPGWKPASSSYLLNQTKPIMQQVFGKEPTVEVIHAGLECGILSGRSPNKALDMISFGPNIRSAHSPKERVEIDSVAKTWEVLLQLLKQIPKE